ncbi:SLC13 family permease [Liquorilactobacillus satsumensis]|uniref:SLC13 family permease n=1 Tax=Liquorilactobacillus satsumensis TaxID=259059 RepID=UPI0039E7375A
MEVLNKIIKDRLLWLSFGAMLLNLLISKPQSSDISWQTIISLTALMLLMQVYQRLKLLDYGALILVRKVRNQRQLIQLLISITFVGSMFLTNDVGIITIVPLLALIARKVKIPLALPIVLINAAANLGSLVTPIGNPQNLYLLAYYRIDALTFFKMAGPITLASILVLWFWSLSFNPIPLKPAEFTSPKIQLGKASLTVLVSILVILGIFAVIPLWIMLGATLFLTLVIDKHLFSKLDYALLLTFICFFITAGDIGRNSAVRDWLQQIGQHKEGVYFTGLGLSQIISNVPAAILLAPYTRHVYSLFLGVNIGGLGTLVASLANLLAYKQYRLNKLQEDKNYLKLFLIVNVTSLFILGVCGYMLSYWGLK